MPTRMPNGPSLFPPKLRIAAAAALLSACATQASTEPRDDVDRLFITYAAIATRPAPMTADEAAETAGLTDRVRTSSDACIGWKFLKLFPVAPMLTAGAPSQPISAADLAVKKEEAKHYLQGLQDPATLGENCADHGFPKIAIQ